MKERRPVFKTGKYSEAPIPIDEQDIEGGSKRASYEEETDCRLKLLGYSTFSTPPSARGGTKTTKKAKAK